MKTLQIALFVSVFICLSPFIQAYNRGTSYIVPNSDEPRMASGSQVKNASYYLSRGYQVFAKYNLAIKFPVKISDLSNQTKDNSDFIYGGFLNKDSESKVVFYQVIINQLPAGYKDLTTSEKKTFEAKLLNEKFPGNKEKVVFMGVDAFVLSYKNNGYSGRSLVFIRNGCVYGFNIMTNDDITVRFNSMTNSIEFIE